MVAEGNAHNLVVKTERKCTGSECQRSQVRHPSSTLALRYSAIDCSDMLLAEACHFWYAGVQILGKGSHLSMEMVRVKMPEDNYCTPMSENGKRQLLS